MHRNGLIYVKWIKKTTQNASWYTIVWNQRKNAYRCDGKFRASNINRCYVTKTRFYHFYKLQCRFMLCFYNIVCTFSFFFISSLFSMLISTLSYVWGFWARLIYIYFLCRIQYLKFKRMNPRPRIIFMKLNPPYMLSLSVFIVSFFGFDGNVFFYNLLFVTTKFTWTHAKHWV